MKQGLEIGPGKSPIALPEYSWQTMGVSSGEDIQCEWGAVPIPLSNKSIDFVYASHVIEHVPYYKTKDALTETFRIMKAGSKIELWTPDFSKIVHAWLGARCGDDWRRFNPEGDPWMWRNGRLFAYEEGADASNWHRSSYTAEELSKLLVGTGFKDAKVISRRLYGADHGACEVGVTALKK